MSDYISRQAAIDAICKARSMVGDYHRCTGYPEASDWRDELVALRKVPAADVAPVVLSRIKGDTAEEVYDFLYWLMFDYARRYTDSRAAVINWLKGAEE